MTEVEMLQEKIKNLETLIEFKNKIIEELKQPIVVKLYYPQNQYPQYQYTLGNGLIGNSGTTTYTTSNQFNTQTGTIGQALQQQAYMNQQAANQQYGGSAHTTVLNANNSV